STNRNQIMKIERQRILVNDWRRDTRWRAMFAVAQVCIRNDTIEKEHERSAARFSVVKRPNEDCSRGAGAGQRRFQTLPQQLSHAQDRVGLHAALLVWSKSISMGGMPNLASSAET